MKKRICRQCGQQIGKYKQYCEACRLERKRAGQRIRTNKYLSNPINLQKHKTRMKTTYLESIGKVKKADRCLICGSQQDLQLHHIQYTGRFAEGAVITLCRKCHGEQRKHKIEKPQIKVMNIRLK